MKCARSACQKPLDGEEHVAIWNEPSTGKPRLYCVGCGMRIIRGNEHDTLKLAHELRGLRARLLGEQHTTPTGE